MAETIGLTLCGLAAIALAYLGFDMIHDNAERNTEKTRAIRMEKLQTCRTIQDEALRTLCVIQGGAKSDK